MADTDPGVYGAANVCSHLRGAGAEKFCRRIPILGGRVGREMTARLSRQSGQETSERRGRSCTPPLSTPLWDAGSPTPLAPLPPLRLLAGSTSPQGSTRSSPPP